FNPSANYIYDWSPSIGLSCDDCGAPIIKGLENDQNFIITVIDTYGCSIHDSIMVRVRQECTRDGFYIPNIFTPYRIDGINDLFRVYAEDATEFISISIYDRWGTKVYTSEILDDTWDGYYKNQKLVSGVYAYILTARCDKTKDIINFAGDITIID
ncbi:MAG: gliding motility-associated C-terminal domain-containing protein, partial [Saprospiraceae bacterium]